MFLNMNMNMNMNMNKIKYILFFNKIIDYIKPTRYYYLRKNLYFVLNYQLDYLLYYKWIILNLTHLNYLK